MKKGKKFLLNTAILTGTSLLLRTLGMSFTVYISNKIGAQGVGVYQLLISVYAFGITLATAGLGLASTRLITDQLARGSTAGAKSALRRCLFFGLLCSLAATALLGGCAGAITKAWFHGQISPLPLRILALSLPFMSVAVVLAGYFTAVRRVAKSASAQILEQLVHMGIAVALLTWVAPPGLEPACLALVIGGVVSEICSCLWLFVLYKADWRRVPKGSAPGSATLGKIFSIVLPVGLSSLVRSGINTYKQVLVPLGLDRYGVDCARAMAQYGLIRGMALPLLQFPSALLAAFSALLIPEMTERHIRGETARIQGLVARIFKTTMIFSVAVTGLLLTYASPLCALLFKDPQVAHFLRLLAPIVVIMYLDDIVDAVLKGLDRQGRLAAINIAESVLSALLLGLLLPRVGIYGFIIALYFSEIINGFLSIRCLLRATNLKFRWVAWLVVPGIAMALACLITQRLMSNLLCSLAFATCLYLLLLYGLGHVTKKDFSI